MAFSRGISSSGRGRARLGDSYAGTSTLDYVLQSNAQGLIGEPIYSSYDGVDQPTQYIGYAPGVTPPEVQQVLAEGYVPETGDFNDALIALLTANGATFKPAGTVIAASTTFVPTPVAPVTGPTQYLEGGVTYTNYDDAVAAAAALPTPPPASTTGAITYDASTDTYVPAPAPTPGSTTALVDPVPTDGTALTADASGGISSWSTTEKLGLAAAAGVAAWFLFGPHGRR